MTITRVQGNAHGDWSSGSIISITLASTPTAGNTLIATISVRTNNAGSLITVSSIIQTGVTWTKQVSKANATYPAEVEIWKGVVGSGASKDVTVNLSGTPDTHPGGVANICEYASALALDKTATNQGASAAGDTGTTATTTHADELWIGTIGVMNQIQSSPTNGFALLDGASYVNFGNGYLEKIVSSTGTANSGTTLSASAYWAGAIATFYIAIEFLNISDSGVGTESDISIGPLGTDAGVGVEAVATSAEMTVADAGAGVEGPTVDASLSSTDSGVGVDAPNIQNQLTEPDAGLGSENLELSASVPVTDAGAAVEAPSVAASFTVTESGAGVDLPLPVAELTIEDSGALLNETVTTSGTLTVSEEGKAAEFAWRAKPENPMIDALVLPHVLSIRITDPAAMSDKKVQGGSLPRRKMVAKAGRTVEIQGWSDSQAEIDALDALRDGVRRTFYHPSGDSFGVLVTGFEPSRTVDQYNRRLYRLAVAEAN